MEDAQLFRVLKYLNVWSDYHKIIEKDDQLLCVTCDETITIINGSVNKKTAKHKTSRLYLDVKAFTTGSLSVEVILQRLGTVKPIPSIEKTVLEQVQSWIAVNMSKYVEFDASAEHVPIEAEPPAVADVNTEMDCNQQDNLHPDNMETIMILLLKEKSKAIETLSCHVYDAINSEEDINNFSAEISLLLSDIDVIKTTTEEESIQKAQCNSLLLGIKHCISVENERRAKPLVTVPTSVSPIIAATTFSTAVAAIHTTLKQESSSEVFNYANIMYLACKCCFESEIEKLSDRISSTESFLLLVEELRTKDATVVKQVTKLAAQRIISNVPCLQDEDSIQYKSLTNFLDNKINVLGSLNLIILQELCSAIYGYLKPQTARRCKGNFNQEYVEFCYNRYYAGHIIDVSGVIRGSVIWASDSETSFDQSITPSMRASECIQNNGIGLQLLSGHAVMCSNCSELSNYVRRMMDQQKNRLDGTGTYLTRLSPDQKTIVQTKQKKLVERITQQMKDKPPSGQGKVAESQLCDLDAETSQSLLSTIATLLESGKLAQDSFFYKFIDQQIRAASLTDGRKMRWSREILMWAESIRWDGGGKTIDELRGPIYEGAGKHGHLKIDINHVRMFLPSIATLKRNRSAILPYDELDSLKLKAWSEALSGAKTCREGIMSFDEIEIRGGLQFIDHLQQIIGFVGGPVKCKDVHTVDLAAFKMDHKVGTHILQLIFTTLDGQATFPVLNVVTGAVTAQECFNIIQKAVDALASVDIITKSSISDGFGPSLEYMTLLKDLKCKGCKVFHAFDFVHLAKNIRNVILNKYVNVPISLEPGSTPTVVKVAMKDLMILLSSDKSLEKEFQMVNADLKKLLTEDVINPVDKMSWEYVVNLFAIAKLLEKLKDPKAKALALYIRNIEVLVNAFEEVNLPMLKRLEKLTAAVNFFKSTLPGHNSKLKVELEVTLETLKSIFLDENGAENYRAKWIRSLSYFSTLVVENFFCVIRSKIRFPSIYEYAICSQGALKELIKKISDTGIPRSGKNISKAYNNVSGLQMDVKLMELLTSNLTDKAKLYSSICSSSKGNENQILWAKDLAAQMPPSRKKLTVREANCKRTAGMGSLLYCPETKCSRMYYYSASLTKHMERKHSSTQPKKKGSDDHTVDLLLPPIDFEAQKAEWGIVIIDVETTGFSKNDAIVQIGAIDILANNAPFIKLVKPPFPIPPSATAIHNITNNDVSKADSVDIVAKQLLDWLANLRFDHILLVAHNAGFDRRIIESQFKTIKFPKNVHWACSGALIKSIRKSKNLPSQKWSLDKLSVEYSEVVIKAHDALADGQLTWRILKKVVQEAVDVEAGRLILECYFHDPTFTVLPSRFLRLVGGAQVTASEHEQQLPMEQPNVPTESRPSLNSLLKRRVCSACNQEGHNANNHKCPAYAAGSEKRSKNTKSKEALTQQADSELPIPPADFLQDQYQAYLQSLNLS